MMRRFKIFIIVFVAVLAVAGILFFRPLPIVPTDSDFLGSHIDYNQRVFYVYCNDSRDKMLYILSRHYARRSFINPYRRQAETIRENEMLRLSTGGPIPLFRVSTGRFTISIGTTHAFIRQSKYDIVVRRIINPLSLVEELRAVFYKFAV